MKKCPYCLADIHEATIICPHCTSDLMDTVPIRVVSRQAIEEKANRKKRFLALAIFGLFIVAVALSLLIFLNSLWNSF